MASPAPVTDAAAAASSQLAVMEAAMAAQQAALENQNMAADLLLKHKLGAGRSRGAKQLSEAVKQLDYQDHLKKVAANKQDEDLKAKLAGGRKGRNLAALANASGNGSDAGAPASAAAAAASSASAVAAAASAVDVSGLSLEVAMAAVFAAEDAREDALAAGSSDADARAAHAQAAAAALAAADKSSDDFLRQLRDLCDVPTSSARALSAPEEALQTKLKKGRNLPPRHVAALERAFQLPSLVGSLDRLEDVRRAEALAAKKKKKLEELSAAESAAAASSPQGNLDAVMAVMEQLSEAQDSALADGRILGSADAAQVQAAAMEATLTDAQKSNEQFMKMLRQMTEAEASKEQANMRQMSASEAAMLAKLSKGKSTKQQKLIEKAFQDSQFVEEVQKAQAKSQEDALAAKLAAGKKKKAAAAAKAAEEEKIASPSAGGDDADAEAAAAEAAELERLRKKKQSGGAGKLKAAVAAAADSAAHVDAMVAAMLYAEEARDRAAKEGRAVRRPDEIDTAVSTAVAEHLTEEQQAAHAEFLTTLRDAVEQALSVDNSKPRLLSGQEEALLRRMRQGKTLKQHAMLDRAFRVTSSVALLTSLEQQKSADASMARVLQNKAAKKKELAAAAAAADSNAHCDAVVQALTYIEAAREKALVEGRGPAPTDEEVAEAQNRAMYECFTEEQRSNEELIASFFKQSGDFAGRPLSDPRELPEADAALLAKLQAAAKTPDAQRHLESLFMDVAVAEVLRGLDAQRGTDAQVARALALKNKKKKEAQLAEQAAEEAAELEAIEAAAERAAEMEAERKEQEASAAAAGKKRASGRASAGAKDGVDAAKEFATMLEQASLNQASQDQALSRQADKQSEALMKKLLQGKSTKQKKLIENALAEAGLVDQKVNEAAKKQDDALAAKLAAGKKKREAALAAASASAAIPVPSEEPPVIVDYLEQKYGEMLAEEEYAKNAAESAQAAAELRAADPAQAVLENQEAIATATTLGMNAGADGVAVAQIAAAAAALGLSPEQITAAATAAAQVSAASDPGVDGYATFMDLFRKATEDAAAEHVRRKAGQNAQEDDFMRRLLRGKRTKQQQMVDKQMADILAANKKAQSYQGAQDADFLARLARGKAKKAGAAATVTEEANRLAAEALAREMLVSNDSLFLPGSNAASGQANAALAAEIDAIANAPTILDELLAVSEAQHEEAEKQARETGLSLEAILQANSEVLELDNLAAQMMLEKAREAEASGDAEGAAAFMAMYRRMLEEQMARDSSVQRSLSAAEEAMMRKLMKGKTTKQQKLIEKAFQNQALVDALLNQEQARQQQLFEAKLALGKQKRRNAATERLADEAFAKLRKIFLGAIKKLDAANIIRALEEALPLVNDGYLDLSKPIKEQTGETMLHQAAKYGRAEVVEWLLLQGGGRPNLGNSSLQTALHFAALALDPAGADQISPDNAATTCMVLIEAGADVHAQDASYDTPLAIAERLGFDLSNLANTQQAQEALQLQRARDEQIEMQKHVEKMQEEALSKLQDEDGMATDAERDAARIAAQVAADAAAKLASGVQAVELAASAALLKLDPATGLPLTDAQIALQKEELELLMNEEKLEIMELAPPAGPLSDPKKIKQANLVFIQLCDLFKDLSSNPRAEGEVLQLLKAHVDLIREGYLDLSRPVKNKQDGSTLLHAAVFHQKLNMVRQLLVHRSDPNRTTIQGETPLHLACALMDKSPDGKAIVSLLLEAGANPLLKDFKTGQSCFEHCPSESLRKWCEDWKPLAERQRLALANQMGGLDELLARNDRNMRNAAYNAEASFLDKLMRGKQTRQGKLLDEALRNNDSLEARTLREQQMQLDAMAARLARGKMRKAGPGGMIMEDGGSMGVSLGPGSSGSIGAAAAKKQAFMEDMLLQELSEPTKDKIMLTAEKWADHPLGLSGLDITVLSKLRGMPIAEALKLLATESAHAQQEQLRLQQAVNAPGLDELQAIEYERLFNIADCNVDIYADLTHNMLEAERKRQEAQGGGLTMQQEDTAVTAARERLDEIARKKEASLAASLLPAEMRQQIAQLFSQYIALHTGYEIEPRLILEGALPMEDLASYQLDVDTIEHMLSASQVEPSIEFLQKQAAVNQAVGENVARQLQEPEVSLLSQPQREETEMLAKLCHSNADLYENLTAVLMGLPAPALQGPEVPPGDAASGGMIMEDGTTLSSGSMMDSTSKDASATRLVHPDTGLSVQSRIEDVVLEQMRELAAEFLGVDPREMRDMNTDQLQQALAKGGVNVDVLEELRKLTEAEAGKWLAREMQKNKAESDMLEKLLRGKGLSDKKRAELLARQKALDDAAGLYNDMLLTLMNGEKKKYAAMSAEEQAAHDKMMAKMAARRRKQEAQELEQRRKRQEEELTVATAEVMRETMSEKMGQQPVERPVLDPETGAPVLTADGQVQMELVYETAWEASGEVPPPEVLEKAKALVVHQLIGDNAPLLVSLQMLAAEHLGMSAAEFEKLDSEHVSMLLAEKGVDINLLDYLKTLSAEEAAKHLARQMAQAEAEAAMLKKLLKGKGLTAAQRQELQDRQRALEDQAKMYEDMLRALLDEEKKKASHLSAAERAALEAMERKLAQRRAREAAKAKEAAQIDEHSPLLKLFDQLAPKGDFDCRQCSKRNDAANRACHFCKKSRADILALPEIVLWSAHRLLHQCSCPMSVIEVVHRAAGPCTKRNFLHFMQAVLIACNRDSHVFWDSAAADLGGPGEAALGALDPRSAELVWAFNEWDVEQPRFHLFKEKHADAAAQKYVGWTDFRDECVQMPTVADYQ